MAHSYTPGLKVLKSSIIDKNRRLPIKGEVRKKVGDSVLPDDIVAKTNLPGNVQIIKVASQLSIGPADILEALKVSEGEQVKKGQLLAQTGGLFGLFKSEIFSETIATLTGKEIEIYNTTGALGAARAANIMNDGFENTINKNSENDYVKSFHPLKNKSEYEEAYLRWEKKLKKFIKVNHG